MKKFITATLLVFCSVSFSQNVNSLWKLSSRNNHSQSINKTDLPLKKLFDLDLNSLKNKLASSPKRNASNSNSKTIISLPNSDGIMESFRVYENAVMDPELALKFPEIKSYVAIGIDNPHARAYFSNSPLGFKSMTLYPDQSAVFIEPVTPDLNTYTVYKKSDKEATLDKLECNVIDYAIGNLQKTTNNALSYKGADDGKLRTFRLALSCTAEYAAYFGGTKALALAGMNNTLTRINGVFEKDFGLKLILIATNDNVIYTNATTDPYSDYTSKSNWRAELKSNLNTTVGSANFDIGHLLGAAAFGGGGDAGCIGCICSDFNKGSGYTCGNPSLFSGDAFDIDYVAHEIGHQLGANHTYTYVNDNAVSQMEPGSGSTIMGYAGSTNQNVQAHSDAYFHAISIQQVTDNIKTKTCSVIISTGNTVPLVNAGFDYTIPKGTPFQLTGSATDANTNDVLTYNWEEMDLGNATTSKPSVTASAGPLFRSYPSSTSATRYLPKMNTILAGLTATSGSAIAVEVLPGVARTLNFRLTVRDNRAGGSANNTDDMIITVDGNSGPFTIDSQNSAVSYAAGSTQLINWTVAGTNANGVNCASVDILLSTDGGMTFPINLLSGTANNGSANVVIPNIPGTTNRIMVKGTSHIFFDVNNSNFTITGSGTADSTSPSNSTISASGITTSTTDLSWTTATDNVGVTGYNIYQNGVLKTTTSATSFAVTGLTASTDYTFYVKAKDAAGNLSASSNIVNVTTLTPPDISVPTISTISASGITTSTTDLSWTTATDNVGVTGYNIYQNGVLKTTTSATSFAVNGLATSTDYTFNVKAKDAAGNLSASSNTVNVTTLTPPDISVPTISTISASGITTSTTDLSWTTATDNVGVTGYNIYQNGVLKTTTSATSFAVNGLTASTDYTFYVKAKDAAGNLSASSNTVNVTTLSLNPKTSYCTSNGTSTAIEYINKVQIGSISNISGNNNGYGDFTSMSTDLFIGNSNTIIITPAWNGLAVREAYCVWVDYNQDGDFEDTDEQIFIKSKTKAITISGNFSIPTTAKLGSTRIRISMKYSAFPSSCGSFSKGEVEDYIVNIKSPSTARPESEIVVTNTTETTINKQNLKLSFNLYPNPVKGNLLNISNLEKPADFRIFNLVGQELERNHIENNAVYVGSLKAGIYLIEVYDSNSTTKKLFIKE